MSAGDNAILAPFSHGHPRSGYESGFESGSTGLTPVTFTRAARLLWLMIAYLKVFIINND